MRAPATTTWCAIAALSAALAINAACPAAAQPPQVVGQAAASDDDGPPSPEAQTPAPVEPTEEPRAAERAEARQPIKFGVSRRVDPFDADDEVPARANRGAANLKLGGIVCVAGCDKPRDSAVRNRNKLE